jgi:hydroxymethylpyrimidine/phosphomethylpyrimidine kinase
LSRTSQGVGLESFTGLIRSQPLDSDPIRRAALAALQESRDGWRETDLRNAAAAGRLVAIVVMRGRVLVIAGSDSGGGAGIQADIKTITALSAFATTAITALTAQNTLGVHGVMPVPPRFIRQQIEVVLSDIGADVIKIGMLGDIATIGSVCDALADFAPDVPVVLDPVMVAKGGHALLAAEAVDTLRRRLLPLSTIITPNVPEAGALTGMTIRTEADMRVAATVLLGMGVPAVLLKGGHLDSAMVTDLLATSEGMEAFAAPRIDTRHTHGTGCTTASAVAAGLAQGLSLRDAVIRARRYVRAAIEAAPGLGQGHGPLNHAVTVDLRRI